jgi:hypothetical protein
MLDTSSIYTERPRRKVWSYFILKLRANSYVGKILRLESIIRPELIKQIFIGKIFFLFRKQANFND